MAEYFFELLAEEIPAGMHVDAQVGLGIPLEPVLEKLGIDPKNSVTMNTTSRRIAIHVTDLPDREPDQTEEIKGPPVKVAYDKEGRPTQALNGFLKKNNASLSEVVSDEKYVVLKRRVTGRPAAAILSEEIPRIVQSLAWPKTMRWGQNSHTFVRPVHSVISIFDGKDLPISIFGIASGRMTVGHRTLAPQSIAVHSYDDYLTKLKRAHVIVDFQERRRIMEEKNARLSKEVGGVPSNDPSILEQWQFLTEFPGVLRAEFRREYLALPEEVLVTVMRVHQKQLPIRDNRGQLTNFFLAVMDNEADPDGNAAYGNSFVTNARFADAKFFYDTDRRKKLSDRLDQLAHLQFQETLGNYLEKTKRIEAIARSICAHLKIDPKDTLTAAHLCKTDLVTEMVKEFTDLQGQIGGIYAREEGHGEAVWQAIYDHYRPLSIDDSLPRTVSGTIVAMADKIDTLAGFFRIGTRPTGSKDPFALRRAAQGVVQILLNRDERQIRIGIDQLIDFALAAHDDAANRDVRRDLLDFFAWRLRTMLEEPPHGFAYDEIAAAMESGWVSSVMDLVDRIAALKAIRNEANFLSILDSAKRIANITAGHDSTQVDVRKLENATERRLNELANDVGAQIDEMISERNYRRALESFAAMAPELETFFKEVMVMVDDPALRGNRMSLLRKIGQAARKIADVTKIVVDRSEYRA